MDEQPNLDDKKTELAVIVAKGMLGAIVSRLGGGLVGGIVVDIVASVIPNQRVDRIVEFLEIFQEKVADIKQDVLEQKMKTEEFIDLLEDGMWQAARALTRERKEQIAALLKYSLYHGEHSHIQQKHLLSLLNQLNNAQIIILKSHSFRGRSDEQIAFCERHKSVLAPPIPHLGSGSTVDIDNYALHESFVNDLRRLALIESSFKEPKKGEVPQFDAKTGTLKAGQTKITPLGRLLLRYIDMTEQGS